MAKSSRYTNISNKNTRSLLSKFSNAASICRFPRRLKLERMRRYSRHFIAVDHRQRKTYDQYGPYLFIGAGHSSSSPAIALSMSTFPQPNGIVLHANRRESQSSIRAKMGGRTEFGMPCHLLIRGRGEMLVSPEKSRSNVISAVLCIIAGFDEPAIRRRHVLDDNAPWSTTGLLSGGSASVFHFRLPGDCIRVESERMGT